MIASFNRQQEKYNSNVRYENSGWEKRQEKNQCQVWSCPKHSGKFFI